MTRIRDRNALRVHNPFAQEGAQGAVGESREALGEIVDVVLGLVMDLLT